MDGLSVILWGIMGNAGGSDGGEGCVEIKRQHLFWRTREQRFTHLRLSGFVLQRVEQLSSLLLFGRTVVHIGHVGLNLSETNRDSSQNCEQNLIHDVFVRHSPELWWFFHWLRSGWCSRLLSSAASSSSLCSSTSCRCTDRTAESAELRTQRWCRSPIEALKETRRVEMKRSLHNSM